MSDHSSTPSQTVSKEKLIEEAENLERQAGQHLEMFNKCVGAAEALRQLTRDSLSVPELEAMIGGEIDKDDLKALKQ